MNVWIDDLIYEKANGVLKELNITPAKIVDILMKKIINTKNIDFLDYKEELKKPKIKLEPKIEPITIPTIPPVRVYGHMTKDKAERIFSNSGFVIGVNSVFSSENRTVDIYWANPKFTFLKYDWTLILNDIQKGILYFFYIPGGAIKDYELVARHDIPSTIDLQIRYGSLSFTDTRSHYNFKRFLKAIVHYSVY